jgi:hypothetical protein
MLNPQLAADRGISHINRGSWVPAGVSGAVASQSASQWLHGQPSLVNCNRRPIGSDFPVDPSRPVVHFNELCRLPNCRFKGLRNAVGPFSVSLARHFLSLYLVRYSIATVAGRMARASVRACATASFADPRIQLSCSSWVPQRLSGLRLDPPPCWPWRSRS